MYQRNTTAQNVILISNAVFMQIEAQNRRKKLWELAALNELRQQFEHANKLFVKLTKSNERIDFFPQKNNSSAPPSFASNY